MFTPVSYPLNDLSLPADGVLLQSSDGIHFKVYKNILALASPIFRDMFELPQPTENSLRPHKFLPEDCSSSARRPPVIELSENSSTLDILLRLIYPFTPPAFPGTSASGAISDAQKLVRAVDPVLAAALKYDMPLVVKALCAKLINATNATKPDGSAVDDTLALRVFALACRYKLKEEARAAAHAALKGRVSGVFVSELHDVSASQYLRLIEFHRNIVSVVESTVTISGLPSPYDDFVKCSICEEPPPRHRDSWYERSKWWTNFVLRALPILRESPKSSRVYSARFLEQMFAQTCDSGDCKQMHGKWQTMSQYIKDTIDEAIAKNDINLCDI
ncbi:hypothetical protein DFH11DRAFT_736382 [Phellopilus nigrolimitatus]|nr:hypothetical protein DFH11DRAFT_736382 [Phellopilus nigrolimitatus]